MNIISKQDAYKVLVELKNKLQIDVEKEMKEVMTSNQVSLDIIHFINKHRPLDVTSFYNKLRKDNNSKKSKLYINIMKETEDINETLITLSSMITQILIYGKTLEGSKRNLFFNNVRLLELHGAIKEYLINNNSDYCIGMLKRIKSDIKILEQSK